MIIRSPNIAPASSCCSFQSLSTSSIPASHLYQQPSLRRRPQRRPQCRSFNQTSRSHASTSSPPNHSSESADTDHVWPKPLSRHQNPSPYDILGLARDAPYSKRRFYELVKLYHPDRCHNHSHNHKHARDPSCTTPSPPSSSSSSRTTTPPSSPANVHVQLPYSQLHPAIRLERYRLIVAAHTILSDPTKRSAYDNYGAGWAGPHSGSPANEARAAAAAARRRNWGSRGNPSMNATWEDWETWHTRGRDDLGGSSSSGSGSKEWSSRAWEYWHPPYEFGENEQQAPREPQPSRLSRLLPNVAVGSSLVVLAVMASMGQAQMAQGLVARRVEERERVHARSGQDLAAVKRGGAARGVASQGGSSLYLMEDMERRDPGMSRDEASRVVELERRLKRERQLVGSAREMRKGHAPRGVGRSGERDL